MIYAAPPEITGGGEKKEKREPYSWD